MTGRRRLHAATVARQLLVLAAPLWLAACASLSRGTSAVADGGALSGRMAVSVAADGATPARSETAGFDLEGSAEAGRLKLSTPLGSVLAEARWSPSEVVLATPRGERRYADLPALTRDVLGEGLPVGALFDWLRGRPWAGAPSAPDPAHPATAFEQLGWSVDLSRYAPDGLVVARRAAPPEVVVRARLER